VDIFGLSNLAGMATVLSTWRKQLDIDKTNIELASVEKITQEAAKVLDVEEMLSTSTTSRDRLRC
jgi:hypothetical protein